MGIASYWAEPRSGVCGFRLRSLPGAPSLR
jgi:hypothetical protein